MNEGMKVSQRGVSLVKEFEGLYLNAYQDSVGVWTIGYGHTQGVYSGMSITAVQAERFLAEDLLNHATGIFKYVTVNLNQNQFDALASFHFNLGVNILYGSELLAYINSKNWEYAANEMKRYVYAGGEILAGLVRRRNAEAALFLDGNIGNNNEKKGRGINMFQYILAKKNGGKEQWGVWGNLRFHFYTMEEVEHFRKLVKANGGDTTVYEWKEDSTEVHVLERISKV